MATEIFVVEFDDSTGSEVIREAYRSKADADKRAAELANEYTEEEGGVVTDAFEAGDYTKAIESFIEECNRGADHRLNVNAMELK